MAAFGNNDTVNYICIPKSSGTTTIIVTLLAFPFHALMIKILGKDVDLSMPRHQIMFCLSISDALQIFAGTIATVVMRVFDLTTQSLTCRVLRDMIVFTSSLTVVVASLTLVTLAIERMTICMHFLKYAKLFARKRTTKLLSSYWVFGVIIAALTAGTNDKQRAEMILGEIKSFQTISAIFIIPSAAIIAIIQFRLFTFSRARMVRIVPAAANTNQRAVPDFRKRQLRIAFVAGIVSVAYIACMVPMAIMFMLEVVGLTDNNPSAKATLVSLAIVNTLADPFIYGFGMAQTRQVLVRLLRRIFCTCVSPTQ